MKSQLLFPFSLLLIGSILISSCGSSLKVPIERGKVTGDFTLQFVKKNVVLKQDQFFNLDEFGLLANGGQISKKYISATDINSAIKLFKKGKIKNYDIRITNPDYKKPYYAKIAFFNTNKNNAMDAVARYYEINIEDSYFESATRGRMALVYEYSDNKIGLVKSTKIPTWMIIMSDEPF
jgi:hypothetical protein